MSDYKCPHCGMNIYDDEALLCHFCGNSLERAGKGFIGRIRYSNQKVLWYFLIFFVIFVFVILLF
jgi:predicted nucleic acid-binding Zn ribbon protein